MIFGVIGVVAMGLIVGIVNKTLMFIVAFLFAAISYGVAGKIFKS